MVRDDAQRAAGTRPRVDVTQVGRCQVSVVGQARPGEHPGLGVAECIGGNSGVFDRLVGHFQQQSLLGVHLGGLAG
jgi:hypothetical protein